MNTQCSDGIDAITHKLGFTCADAPAVIRLSDPFGLANPTMPVLELLIVSGAAFALWWAVRRMRRDGDPVNLVLWCATVIYLLIIEPPLYFPNVFGVEQLIGPIFAHNIFTVQFMYDRLPLYIVALYPAMATLAYEIVRSLGIFRSRGIVVGALCVGFVHQCFYEVFDQLGPQLRWWAWNTDTPVNQPLLASVPMSSVLLFATIGPALLTAFTLLLAGRPADSRRRIGASGLVLRTMAVAILMPPALVVVNIPIALAQGDEPAGALRWAVYAVYMGVFAVTALRALGTQMVSQRHTGDLSGDRPNLFVRVFGTVYLVVLAGLWGAALPDHLGGSGGISASGTPTGHLGYAAVCFVLAAVLTVAVSRRANPTTQEPNEPFTSEVAR